MTLGQPAAIISKSLVPLRAFIVAFSAALLVALLGLAQQSWSGANDLKPFLLFTSVFSALVAVLGVWASRLLGRSAVWLRYTAGGLAGLVVGFLFTLGNQLYLGGWFGAWSVPVFVAWLVGGMLGFAAATGTRSGMGIGRLAVEQLSFLCLLLILSFGLPDAVRVATRNQELTLVYARWYPGDPPLKVEDPRHLLLARDHELLRDAQVFGRLVVRGSHASNTVKYPKARMVVLVSSQPTRRVALKEPFASTVIYWQDGYTFRHYPEDPVLLDRAVELVTEQLRPDVTAFWVADSTGNRSGADMFNWSEKP